MQDKNSWLIQVPDTSTPYKTFIYNHFICRCGQTDIVKTALNETEDVENCCSQCANDCYINVNDFKNGRKTVFWKQFEWQYEGIEKDGQWTITIYYYEPSLDYDSFSIVMERVDLFSYVITHNGKFDSAFHASHIKYYRVFRNESVCKFHDLIRVDAVSFMVQFILSNMLENLKWINAKLVELGDDVKKLQAILFFLQNSHLKEFDFIRWELGEFYDVSKEYSTVIGMLEYIRNGRHEKSVKKAQFEHYQLAIKGKGYHPICDYVFSYTIEDPNLLVRLISLHPAVKAQLFATSYSGKIVLFLNFLLRHYTQRQLTNFFVGQLANADTFKEHYPLWKDTLQMINHSEAITVLDRFFIKVKLHVRELHDEIAHAFHLYKFEDLEKQSLSYEPKYTAAQSSTDGLTFKLPTDLKQLHLWSKKLHNCMFGYADRIHHGQSVIYGVFKNNQLTYAVELTRHHINQAKGVSNTSVPQRDMSIIKKWVDCYGLLRRDSISA